MVFPAPLLLCALGWNCNVSVLTYHNDLGRTGQNLHETLLTPASVGSSRFGRLFTYPVDGQVYAQPLYVPGVVVPGKGIHNVIVVATEHDSVYAFDADNDLAGPLWQVSFLDPAQGVTTASATDVACGSIVPEIGITATPVIDDASGALYVVAMTEEGSGDGYVHRLHALDVATGAEKPASPVEISASVPGRGDGNNTIQFKPWLYKERAGLLLLKGAVYTAWSSECDSGNYHGWLIGYDAGTLQQVAAYADTPDWEAGSFWQSGAAPAADAKGNIYVVSANGTFDANQGGSDLGDSVIKLSTSRGLTVADYFAPYNAGTLDNEDLDVGSSGALLLPDAAGSPAHPHLLVSGSKSGSIYLLDQDNLGQFHAGADDQIVQSIQGAVGPVFGIPAYFNNTLYFSAAHDQLKAFPVRDGLLSAKPASATSSSFAVLGSVPSISANGAADGIVWTIDPTGLLQAYDASDLSLHLYQGSLGSSIKFSTPTIANGKVYVGTTNSLVVFGFADPGAGPVSSIVSSAGFRPGPVAPGSLISLFGSNLDPRNSSVFINGLAAPIAYAGPTQINALVPAETAVGPAVVNVVTGEHVLPPQGLLIQPVAPSLFVDSSNHAVAQTAAPDAVTIFLTGQGVNPSAVAATIDGALVDVIQSGMVPGSVGVFAVTINTSGLSAGDHSLAVAIAGVVSEPAVISVSVH
jgi:uncharacterized protein (TIGR03437 family)